MKPIFLDYNSTTPVDPIVVEEMLPYFSTIYGNPSSQNHSFGIEAKNAIKNARIQIASLINCQPNEIFFTSGATESINLALKGYFESNHTSNIKYLTLDTEHKAVLDCLEILVNKGLLVETIRINNYGIVDLNHFNNDLLKDVSLISVMHANNEIGVIQPIEEISKIIKSKNIHFFVDGAQSVGKIPVDVKKLDVDMMAISAHKFYGPKGIGALYINNESNIELASQIDGGGHEKGLRSGTLNVPAIVGFGKAAELSNKRMKADSVKITKLRDMLLKELQNNIDGVFINGDMNLRLPNNLNVSFSNVDGDSLLIGIDDIAISNGSACSSNKKEPSYVLKALGVDDKLASASIRFGLGRNTTYNEIMYTVNKFKRVVSDLRSIEELKNELAL